MAQTSVAFPRVGRWEVKLSAFDSKVPQHVPEGSRITVAEAAEDWLVSVQPPDAPLSSFPGRTLAAGVLEVTGPAHGGPEPQDVFHLRPVSETSGSRFLVGIWFHRRDREDTPIGVWVSEEDTKDSDGDG